MSRIGKLPITIPAGVSITQEENVITVKGPKGTLTQYINPNITISVEDSQIEVKRPNDEKENRAMHGLYRSLIQNMVTGVSDGFTTTLELIGVGYRASHEGQVLELALGFTHNVFLVLPSEVKVDTKMERNKAPLIILESTDKQLLGQVCAKIRSLRKPEPYKGKGVRFLGEEVRRKAGKSAAAGK